MANFIVPPFAPVFTQRNPDNPNAIVAAANVNYMDDNDWKFLGVAFTGCTLHQVLLARDALVARTDERRPAAFRWRIPTRPSRSGLP